MNISHRTQRLTQTNSFEKLINRVDQLENFPKSGRSVLEFSSETIRELIEGNYRIVYKINPDHIGVVRVHHSARQLK